MNICHRQLGNISGLRLAPRHGTVGQWLGSVSPIPSDEVFFLLCVSGRGQSHSPAAVQETQDETSLAKHVLSTTRSLGAQLLGF